MDSRLIVQVIINIVNNAVQYTPPGSPIRVSARKQGRQVLVEIADNGPGISDEDKDRLFDMFYTAGNTRGDGRRGLGLGLSLCKSIVSAHGGVIEVRDNSPHGTIFSFTLPLEEISGLQGARQKGRQIHEYAHNFAGRGRQGGAQPHRHYAGNSGVSV